jgi:predicted CXXCH cytochrome family protein
MNAYNDPEIECEECHKTFPAREIKYNKYFRRYLCTGCHRKLAAQRGAAGLWRVVKINLIGWAVLIIFILIFSLMVK